MIIDSCTISGIFLEEKKNRFLCDVMINGTVEECYIPSSCRLSNFIDLTNKKVFLTENQSKNSRTNYTVSALKYKNAIIPLNMSVSNRVIEETIRKRRFSFLGSRSKIFREKMVCGYKSDLYIDDTRTIVEIKSILSFDSTAKFPTVYSERAVEQLKQLSKLLDAGYKACYIFVSLNSGVKCIKVNKEITDYYTAFEECIRKGMMPTAYSIFVDKSDNVKIKGKIDLEWS